MSSGDALETEKEVYMSRRHSHGTRSERHCGGWCWVVVEVGGRRKSENGPDLF
jgi:hypothetical protein